MPGSLPPGVSDSMLPGNRPEDIEYEKQVDLEVGSIDIKMFREEIKNRWGSSLASSEIEKMYFEDWHDSGLLIGEFIEKIDVDSADIRK